MLTVNVSRLLNDINELAQIGQTPRGGVSRTTFSQADLAGRAWFRQRVQDSGLICRQDGAGNLSAILGQGKQSILVGSHLDTVPEGGRFDGAVGVLSALEALRTIQEAGIDLPVAVEAISFTDEEGSILSLLGSRALTGALTAEELAQSAARWDDATVGMAQLGITEQTILAAGRDPQDYLVFVELHIEQGRRLENDRTDIGIVTSIVGIRNFWLHFQGEAAHAGTKPMPERSDALWGAARTIYRAKDLVMDRFTPGVMNCGILRITPSAFNIVPGGVQLGLEFRHGTDSDLDEMQRVLFDLARDVAKEHGLTLEIEPVGNVSPALMDSRVMNAIATAADSLNLTHTRLMSLAGHDTQMLSRFVPSAMFFIPSVEGISHNPHEFTCDEDLINGANVLVNTIITLAEDLR